MALANIISAIGNNSSVYPLIVRDCGIEVPTKIALTYYQNKQESKEIAYLGARERFMMNTHPQQFGLGEFLWSAGCATN